MPVQGGRHYERFELNRPCRASRNGTARTATLSDISGSGARLKFINRPGASTNPFMAGNRLEIENFPCVTGTVVRSTPAEVAVQFHTSDQDVAHFLEAIVAAVGDGRLTLPSQSLLLNRAPIGAI